MLRRAFACRWLLLVVALLASVPGAAGTALGSSIDSNPLFGSKPEPTQSWLTGELRPLLARAEFPPTDGTDGGCTAIPHGSLPVVSASRSPAIRLSPVAAGGIRPLCTSPAAPRAPPRLV